MYLEDKSPKDLVIRLNEIMVEIDKLELEHNQIVSELMRRFPNLKDDPNLEFKKIRRR